MKIPIPYGLRYLRPWERAAYFAVLVSLVAVVLFAHYVGFGHGTEGDGWILLSITGLYIAVWIGFAQVERERKREQERAEDREWMMTHLSR